jgi:hypothetical protein
MDISSNPYPSFENGSGFRLHELDVTVQFEECHYKEMGLSTIDTDIFGLMWSLEDNIIVDMSCDEVMRR